VIDFRVFFPYTVLSGVKMWVSEKWRDITILCKVVDNYGDIGFVYRLARSLSSCSQEICLRIIVSDLVSFQKMAPGLSLSAPEQQYNGWTVYDWNNRDVCARAFTQQPPQVILECFQCGRPAWLDDILFDKKRKEIVQVLNVEYLTAEKWADDFHLLKSGTRSPLVKKVNFMPGFSAKTGGLVLDEPFMSYVRDRQCARAALVPYLSLHDMQLLGAKNVCSVIVFSYPRDFASEVRSLALYERQMQKRCPEFKVHVFAANGRSLAPFLESYHAVFEEDAFSGCLPFSVTELPFLPQTAWDALLCLSDISFVRGEDSLSRACLAGVPFFWHAYPQAEEYQLVKVNALLSAMKPFFELEEFEALRKYVLLYNRTSGVAAGKEAAEVLADISLSAQNENSSREALFLSLLQCRKSIHSSFTRFAQNIASNGNLAQKLVEYLKQLQF